MKILAWSALFFFILVNFASASVISGEIYGPDFEKINESQIKIYENERVVQSVLTKNGSYSVEIGPGEYVIEGSTLEDGKIALIERETIKIEQGSYFIDLILLPISDELFDSFDLNTEIDSGNNYAWVFVMIIILIAIYYFYKSGKLKLPKQKASKEELPKELKEVLKIIEKSGGRINQLELRKQLPYSEAKVSLMIADLESREFIRKIKKGRGNILVLQ